MLRTKTILLLFLILIMLSSCIKSFNPGIRSKDVNKLVITGQVTDGEGSQTINISWTSPIDDPHYIPITGCSAKILDDKGNKFTMSDAGNGDYNTWIDPVYLISGNSFMLEVITPSGDTIRSGFDQLSDCPEVDSVYFLRKDIEGSNPGQVTRGIRFYIDMNGEATDSHYYRWDLVETWEYHSAYPLEWYYDGTVHHIFPPDYSRNICWTSKKVPDIITLSTDLLAENKYKMLPLHYVSNRTPRLMYGYSLLIKQYALSAAAYIYWDQMSINSSQQGGLYTSQPLPIKGNMHNLTHPEFEVLGFFGATSMKTKRIFVQNVEGLTLDFTTFCSIPPPNRRGFQEYSPSDYPVYLYKFEPGKVVELSEDCVNCIKMGGTTEKPDFWPN